MCTVSCLVLYCVGTNTHTGMCKQPVSGRGEEGIDVYVYVLHSCSAVLDLIHETLQKVNKAKG